jgi:hypothetical protein
LVNPITCQSREHFEQFFSQCIERQSTGIVLRDPTAWYFKGESFFTKKPFEEALLMKVGPKTFKW